MENRTSKPKHCKHCIYWKSHQSELDYCCSSGICTNEKLKFHISGNHEVRVLDRENLSKIHTHTHDFEHLKKDVISPSKSRYCLVTGEEFGCIHFDELK